MGGLWLVRHGATTAPVGVAIGLSNPSLSPEGKQQAKALAGRLSRRPLLGVYASDRIRAIETATSIAAPHRLVVQVDARLRELDFGRWEYRDLAALWKEEPEAAAAWERSLRATPASFGESLTQLEERVAAFLKDAREAARGGIAVVAHRGPLAVLRSLVTGESLESTFASGFPVGSAFWLTVDAGLVAERADGVEDAREIRTAGDAEGDPGVSSNASVGKPSAACQKPQPADSSLPSEGEVAKPAEFLTTTPNASTREPECHQS